MTPVSFRHKRYWDTNVGDSIAVPQHTLSNYGIIVENAIMQMGDVYATITVDKYVIMPNHIHMILMVESDGRAMLAPTVSHVIQQMKGIVTKQIGHFIWQKSFRDHIIRGYPQYLEIWQYIDTNPIKWELDCYYTES